MTETETVHVDLADRSYDIVIGDGVLARAGALMSDIVGGDRVIVVTDETVAKFHLDTLAHSLGDAEIAPAPPTPLKCTLPAS
nr:3-dehydroquinate synthase [Rhodospirillaceae bacterium]